MPGDRTECVEGMANQLSRFASDLSNLYRSEKSARVRLEMTNQQVQLYAQELGQTLRQLTDSKRQLEAAYLDTVHRLSMAAEYKDPETGEHIQRMGRYSALLAQKAELPEDAVESILYAAPMHDVGKIGVPEALLLYPGRFTPAQFEVVKQHTVIGSRLLSGSASALLNLAGEIALNHHENWDGTGYPRRLAGEAIPMAGRIVRIADMFDALTTKRPYKGAYPADYAVDMMRGYRETLLDPHLLDIFLDHIEEFIAIRAGHVPTYPSVPLEMLLSQRDLDEIHNREATHERHD